MSLLTTTSQIPGSGDRPGPMTPYGRLQTADPLAQLSQVPWDRLDRFQLSKVCKRLKIKHKAGEKKDVLLGVLSQRLEMGLLQVETLMAHTRDVLVEEHKLKATAAEHKEQNQEFVGEDDEPEKPKETIVTKEVIKTTDGVNVSEILELATANIDRLIEIAAAKGIKAKKPDGRAKIVAEIQKAMGL